MKYYFNTIIILLLSAFIFGCSEKFPERPNIIFILADDLGIHQIGAYGSSYYETPNIDRMAQEGMKFTNAYAAAPVCSPTRASIMTGKYPAALKLTDFIPGKIPSGKRLIEPAWRKFLPEEETTIAEHLKRLGYRTGHFGKWHLNIDKNYKAGRVGDPGSQGFDVVLTTHKPGAGPPSKYENDHHHVKEITQSVLKFIEDNKETPFFAYVTHNSIHAPEIESDSLIDKYKKKRGSRIGGIFNPVQAAMLETLDKSISEILLKIEEVNLDHKTLIIFFSDNGQLAEKNNVTFSGSKGDLYEGGIHMPLIFRWPGVIKPASSCDELVISNDFFNTILEITSDKNKSKFSSGGISLLPYLLGDKPVTDRKAIYWHYPHYHGNGLGPQGAVRKGKYKLIEWYEKSYLNESGMYELYDLESDPGEKNNLADSLTSKLTELANDLKIWRDTIGAQEMTINRNKNITW